MVTKLNLTHGNISEYIIMLKFLVDFSALADYEQVFTDSLVHSAVAP